MFASRSHALLTLKTTAVPHSEAQEVPPVAPLRHAFRSDAVVRRLRSPRALATVLGEEHLVRPIDVVLHPRLGNYVEVSRRNGEIDEQPEPALVFLRRARSSLADVRLPGPGGSGDHVNDAWPAAWGSYREVIARSSL